jgi:hypothetical protein
MPGILKLGIRLFRKPSFVFHVGNRTRKYFTPRGISSRRTELIGNSLALQVDFWKEHVLAVKPIFWGLAMPKGVPMTWSKVSVVENFLKAKLNQALTYPTESVNKTIDFKKLYTLAPCGLNVKLIDTAEKKLDEVHLPVTSAHGDLHIGNIISYNKNIKVIDWSMFSAQGSFITDYIHFFNYRNYKRHIANKKESWAESILRVDPYLSELSQHCAVPVRQLQLTYCLVRILGELKQKRSAEDLKKKQIRKYNKVLNRLLND